MAVIAQHIQSTGLARRCDLRHHPLQAQYIDIWWHV